MNKITTKTNSNNNNKNNINSLNINAMKNANNTFRTTSDQTNALIQSLAVKAVAGNAEATNKLINMLYSDTLSFLTYKFKGDYRKAQDMTQDLWVKVWCMLANGSYSPEKGSGFKSWLNTVATNMFLDSARREKKFVSIEKVEYKASKQDTLDCSYEANTDDCDSSDGYYDAMKAPEFASDDCSTSEGYYDAAAAAIPADGQEDGATDTPEDATDAGNPAYCLNADPLTLMIAAEEADERKTKIVKLRKAINELPENQQIVVKECYLGGEQFNEIAEECGKPLATVLSYGRRGRQTLIKKMTGKDNKNRA